MNDKTNTDNWRKGGPRPSDLNAPTGEKSDAGKNPWSCNKKEAHHSSSSYGDNKDFSTRYPRGRQSEPIPRSNRNESDKNVWSGSTTQSKNNSSYDSSRERFISSPHVTRPQSEPHKERMSNARTDPWQECKDREFLVYKKDFSRCRGDFDYVKIKEITHDLFELGEEYSLAHCVAEDMIMSSGIAVPFRRTFKCVDVLLNQREKPGGLAILNVANRFIYYLVTKQLSSGKPTYENLFSSLKRLRQHVIKHNVKKLAMPRIGCGLDRLEWDKVKFMLEFVFQNVDVEIVVCNIENAEFSPNQRNKNCRVVDVLYPIQQIESGTIVVYFCSEDNFISEEMTALNEKFNFLFDFRSSKKSLGDVIFFTKNPSFLLSGCVVKKTQTDPIDFAALQKCIHTIQNENKKKQFYYVGFQAVRDDSDPIVTKKVVNIVQNTMKDVDVYVCGPGNDLNVKNDSSQFSSSISSVSFTPDNSVTDWDSEPSVVPEINRSRMESQEVELNQTLDNSYANAAHWSNEPQTPSAVQNSSVQEKKDEKLQTAISTSKERPNFEKYISVPQTPPVLQNRVQEAVKNESCQTAANTSNEFAKFEKEMKKITLSKVKEQILTKPYSCVCFAGEDMILESGLPPSVNLSECIGKLINANEAEGGVAIFEDGNNLLYVLIIKSPTAPPTLGNIFTSIQKMRNIAKKQSVKKLVIPKMTTSKGDSVDWSVVPLMFEYVFKTDAVEIAMQNFDKIYDVPGLKLRNKNSYEHVKRPCFMTKNGIIIYFASEDGHISDLMRSLDKKFGFCASYVSEPKILGKVVTFRTEKVVLCGCIVRKTSTSNIDFEALQKCVFCVNQIADGKIRNVCTEAVTDEDDTVNFKILTILLHFLKDVAIDFSWPKILKDKMPTN